MIGGLLYVLLFAAWCTLGLPLGFALFGRRHAAGWITGALLGYGLVAILHWGIVQLGLVGGPTYAVVFGTASLVIWRSFRHNPPPWIVLPVWTRRDTLALLLVLLLVPLLQWRPFTRLGEVDANGGRRYRATSPPIFLARGLDVRAGEGGIAASKSLPGSTPTALLLGLLRSPRSRRPSPSTAGTKSLLLINAFCAGLLFVAAIFILAWCVVPRAGPVAVAVACVVLAASAEGAYALWDFWFRGRPLSGACELNIDAITAWWFQTLTIDSLPRSPVHATTCNGLRILIGGAILPVRGGTNVRSPAPRRRPRARTGVDLQPISRRRLCADLRCRRRLGQCGTKRHAADRYALAVIPVVAALGWCRRRHIRRIEAPSHWGSRAARPPLLWRSWVLRWVPCSSSRSWLSSWARGVTGPRHATIAATGFFRRTS